MDFVVIDVETANQNPSSICQIGIACFCSGKLSETWGALVDPEDSFLPFNMKLHGIRPKDVFLHPTWPDLQPRLRAFIEGRTLASHTFFDRAAMKGANDRYGLATIPIAGWLDTCSVARLTWPHLPNHKLNSLASTFGIAYQAHNAAEDARCAGEILLQAARASSFNLDELLRAGHMSVCSDLHRQFRRRPAS